MAHASDGARFSAERLPKFGVIASLRGVSKSISAHDRYRSN
jgi:hypothetical protein